MGLYLIPRITPRMFGVRSRRHRLHSPIFRESVQLFQPVTMAYSPLGLCPFPLPVLDTLKSTYSSIAFTSRSHSASAMGLFLILTLAIGACTVYGTVYPLCLKPDRANSRPNACSAHNIVRHASLW